MWYFAATDIAQHVIDISIKAVAIGAALLLFATGLAIWANKRLSKKHFARIKLPVFVLMLGTVVVTTAVLAFNTVYLNVVAESKGPVHWHADIEFWACGSEIELRDPQGALSNKIGTSTYHEHNDKRIHLEGVVVDKKRDASLGKFMAVTGGYLNKQGIGIPLNKDQSAWLAAKSHQDGDLQRTDFLDRMSDYVGESPKGPVLELHNGSLACGDKRAQLQVFVYQFDKATNMYHQTKLADPADYAIRDEEVVPPGNCIIFDFDKPKSATDKLCEQYGIRDSKRCEAFGVKPYNPDLCKIRYEGVR